jgi:hypothetical protein
MQLHSGRVSKHATQAIDLWATVFALCIGAITACSSDGDPPQPALDATRQVPPLLTRAVGSSWPEGLPGWSPCSRALWFRLMAGDLRHKASFPIEAEVITSRGRWRRRTGDTRTHEPLRLGRPHPYARSSSPRTRGRLRNITAVGRPRRHSRHQVVGQVEDQNSSLTHKIAAGRTQPRRQPDRSRACSYRSFHESRAISTPADSAHEDFGGKRGTLVRNTSGRKLWRRTFDRRRPGLRQHAHWHAHAGATGLRIRIPATAPQRPDR